MKKIFLLIISILVFNFAQSQSHPKIEDYPFGSLDVDVIVMSFGMEHPIKIGSMSKSGEIKFEIPKELPKLSKEAEDNFMNDVAYTLFDVCDNGSDLVSGNDNIKSFETGALSLWTKDNRYVGVIIAVSDEKLLPWIEDPGYNEPILESYFELIYVASPFKYKGECTQTQMLDEGNANITFEYNLNLKAGFNFVEYKIESIHKTDPNVIASFPNKVSVTNVEDIPNCKWIGKYF
ncbi:hypothetical protein ADIWIN_1780 [Winogradskyella psychrotolerans RS-3]|uniref:Uncharacterized protein n=1 Tax=Winogradskyella psychrotolerans RS-3 TaxID=641526 RepID=S7X2U6_9FLAO|nr:hypothetical protein [Winogradskyella psychrotolerans]EPR73349.1 hypothetical protein ADIWIN_1780 [Winogradskyella psychrotolerans RS-3]